MNNVTKFVVKLILLLSISIIITPTDGISQIYVSVSNQYGFLFGPANISNDKALVAPFYIDYLGEIRIDVSNKLEEYKKLITDLEQKDKLKRKERRALRIAYRKIEEFDDDLIAVDSLLSLWKQIAMFQESLIDASELIEEGKCIEFTTDKGTFNSKETKIEISESKDDIEFKEIMYFDHGSLGTTWVKKKSSANCTSPDPNDCMILCLVTSKEFSFIDILGNNYNYDKCPDNFEYYFKKDNCERGKEYNQSNDIIEKINLVNIKNDEILVPLSWKLIECK